MKVDKLSHRSGQQAGQAGAEDGMDDGALAAALERLAFSARIAGRAEP